MYMRFVRTALVCTHKTNEKCQHQFKTKRSFVGNVIFGFLISDFSRSYEIRDCMIIYRLGCQEQNEMQST